MDRNRWDHLVDYVFFFIAYTPTVFFEDDPTVCSRLLELLWKKY